MVVQLYLFKAQHYFAIVSKFLHHLYLPSWAPSPVRQVCSSTQSDIHYALVLDGEISLSENINGSQFKSVRIEGSNISLDGFQFDGLDTQRQLKPFPVCLGDYRSPFEAVLVFMGCMEAMMYLHSFA